MIFGQDRNELRKMYAEAWKKQLAGQPMSPLELQIAAVVAQHPEYHAGRPALRRFTRRSRRVTVIHMRRNTV
jgi:hypothetical protein